jgi:hypothetical protein
LAPHPDTPPVHNPTPSPVPLPLLLLLVSLAFLKVFLFIKAIRENKVKAFMVLLFCSKFGFWVFFFLMDFLLG